MKPARNQLMQLYWRHETRIKAASTLVFLIFVCIGYYQIPPMRRLMDKAITPAVAGITVVYGKVSTWLYQSTGVNLGFVSIPPDPEFVYSVRLATYINERRAGPLLDLAVDVRLPPEKRERALQALLRFESTEDWIQPFLNELSKGGLLYLYDEQNPLLADLIKRIRADGGVRQSLVRAYAEVVMSFMLQHPDLVMRKHAIMWVSDIIAEDALFLLIPRFEREREPVARALIEKALYDIRAISEPETAKQRLAPYYQKPSWPSLRLPIAAILTRLGHVGASGYINSVAEKSTLDETQKTALRLALARTPYPRQLAVMDSQKRTMEARRIARERQLRVAVDKQRRFAREQLVREKTLARTAPPPPVVPAPGKKVKPVAESKEDKKTASSAKPEVADKPSVEAKKSAPQSFPIPGSSEPEYIEDVVQEPEVVASLPRTDEGYRSTRPPSMMNLVDMVFEVTGKQADIYQNPGMSGRPGATLTVGSKGKASFEFLIGEERWYQVKTKQGEGWVKSDQLRLFDLSPQAATVDAAGNVVKKEPSLDDGRAEETFFESSVENAPLFDTPSDDAKKVGQLNEGTSYLAVRSEKVGPDRWFLLKLDDKKTAWARGIDLRLADIPQPSLISRTSEEDLSLRGKKSAFKAEWIVAGVKGVGVYKRPSIAGTILGRIDPPLTYKVVESFAGDGKEWYKIEIPNKEPGWVQVMDVSLTTSPTR